MYSSLRKNSKAKRVALSRARAYQLGWRRGAWNARRFEGLLAADFPKHLGGEVADLYPAQSLKHQALNPAPVVEETNAPNKGTDEQAAQELLSRFIAKLGCRCISKAATPYRPELGNVGDTRSMGNSPEGDTTNGFEQLGDRDRVSALGPSPAARATIAALDQKARHQHQRIDVGIGVHMIALCLSLVNTQFCFGYSIIFKSCVRIKLCYKKGMRRSSPLCPRSTQVQRQTLFYFRAR